MALLAYAESTVDASTASTSFADLSGITVTLTTSGPVVVKVHAALVTNSSASGATVFKILKDGSVLGGEAWVKPGVANAGGVFHHEAYDNPTAASHTYKLQYRADTAGTSSIWGTTFSTKYFIQVVDG